MILFFLAVAFSALPCPASEPLNFIIIFADDQGYNDMGCFGAKRLRTPHLDRLAKEGTRFTSFYSAASVCTPSRAALLTGCYPGRVGKLPVLFPRSDIGINPAEETIAEILKSAGYRTACYGKWHLGHHRQFLPTQNGFDEYFGIPYSNDMGIDPSMPLAEKVHWRNGASREKFMQGGTKEPPLFEGEKVVEWPADQTTLTLRYQQRACRFIEQCAKDHKPFFLYLPHTMPHIPLYVTDKFRGQSDSGLYGDTIEEIDDAVGKIIQTLKKNRVSQNTIVVYTSDNGPWNLKGNRTDKIKGNMNRRIGGSAFPLRGFKFSTWEGGMRVPTIFWGPTHVLAGKTCDRIAGTIDLLPTFVAFSGATRPQKKIDGKNLLPLLKDPQANSPHQAFFYGTEAVRQGNWKLKGNALFNLEQDISESQNVANQNPKVVAQLKTLLSNHKIELSKNARKPGRYQRPPQTIGGLPAWTQYSGNWNYRNGNILHQANAREESLSLGPRVDSPKFEFSCKARIKKGSEGFRLVIGATSSSDYLRWSCGAYKNTLHSFMQIQQGKPTKRSAPFQTSLKKNQWYQLRIVAQTGIISCWIDDQKIHQENFPVPKGSRIGIGSNLSAVEFMDGKLLEKGKPRKLF